MSGRPRKEIAASNGHGRASVYGAPSAEISNLILEASPAKTEPELEKALRDSCAQQGMEYGLRIVLLDLPFLSGREDLRGRGQESLSPPVLAYKVYVADGRRELVRGLSVSDADVRTLREITAAGDVSGVWSRPYVGRGLGFSSAPGPIGTESLAVSVVAPALLFDEIELKFPGSRWENRPFSCCLKKLEFDRFLPLLKPSCTPRLRFKLPSYGICISPTIRSRASRGWPCLGFDFMP